MGRQSFADDETRRAFNAPAPVPSPIFTESRQSSRRIIPSEVIVPSERVTAQDQSVNSALKEKTTSIETLTWTPALLQGFSPDQSRQPKNEEVFVFYRS